MNRICVVKGGVGRCALICAGDLQKQWLLQICNTVFGYVLPNNSKLIQIRGTPKGSVLVLI